MDSGEETKPKKKGKANPFSFFNYMKDGTGQSGPAAPAPQNHKTDIKAGNNNVTSSQNSFGDSDSDDDLLDDDEDDNVLFKPPPVAVSKPKPEPKRAPTLKPSLFDDGSDSALELKKQVASLYARIEELKARSDKVEQENSKTQTENNELKSTLKKMKFKVEQAGTQIEALEIKLEQQKKKELADAKELEDMIAQVEENLTKTTQRAQQAEAQIEHLKLELASSRISNLRGDDNIVQSAEHLKLRLLEARDKAKVASSSLMKAATDAEDSIRDLLKGVDTLRTVSGILSAIDKLTIIDSNL